MTERSAKKHLDLNTTQVAAGSMASVTSAVAASNLGVAGTLVGAGVGSMIGAVAGAVYEHYIDRTRHHVRSKVPLRPAHDRRRVDEPAVTAPAAVDAAAPDTDQTSLPPSLPTPGAEQPNVAPEDKQPTWTWLRSHRTALGVSAAAAFGLAVVALTGFEALTGQPISSQGTGDGGTSISRVIDGISSPGGSATDPAPTPSPGATTGDEPASPAATTPATPAPSATEQAPTQQSTSSPTAPVPQATPASGG